MESCAQHACVHVPPYMLPAYWQGSTFGLSACSFKRLQLLAVPVRPGVADQTEAEARSGNARADLLRQTPPKPCENRSLCLRFTDMFTEGMQALMMSPKAADCGCPTVSYLCAPTRGLFASPRVDGRPGAGNCWPCCSKCRGFSRLTEPLPLVLRAAGAESTVRQSAKAFGKQPSQSRWTAGPLPQ